MKTKSLTAITIANLLNGELIGDNQEIKDVGTLQDGKMGEVGFLADNKYTAQLADTALSLVLVEQHYPNCPASQIIVKDVRHAWRELTEKMQAERISAQNMTIHDSAIIADSATIGANCAIGAGVVIGENVQIGDNCRIEALAYLADGITVGDSTHIGSGVKILSGTTIGARCHILANAVIGERGFGNHFENGRWLPIPQLGGVRIGDDVEIGASTMIDRGAVGDTIIGNGVKLDNLIQIAHNVEIGEHTAIAGCCVIAGSVKFGKYCVVGGASVFAGHISICDGAQFAGHSSVSKSVTQPGLYCSALTIMPDRQWKRFVAKLRIFGREK